MFWGKSVGLFAEFDFDLYNDAKMSYFQIPVKFFANFFSYVIKFLVNGS